MTLPRESEWIARLEDAYGSRDSVPLRAGFEAGREFERLAAAASAHQTPAGGGRTVAYELPLTPPPPEGPSYPNGPLTPEQQQRLAEVRAKWDEKFADAMEAIRETGRITETDLSIHVTGAELPPEGPGEPGDKCEHDMPRRLHCAECDSDATLRHIRSVEDMRERAAGAELAEAKVKEMEAENARLRSERERLTREVVQLAKDVKADPREYMQLQQLRRDLAAAEAKVKELEVEVGDKAHRILQLEEQIEIAETDRDKTGELFNAALADYNAEKERAERAERYISSIAFMLGWQNVPPQATLERDLNARAARLASLTQELDEEKRRGEAALAHLVAAVEECDREFPKQEPGTPGYTAWLWRRDALKGALDRLRSSRAEQGGKSDG